ncbi:MAG: hypothetical protein WD793_02570 [Steroidobacteraceae bacterium]
MVAIAVTAVAWWCGVKGVRLATLACGLEGTALLASALSAPVDEMGDEVPRNWLKQVPFWFGEGSSYGWPVRYNPVCYYGGLLLLAVSITMSAVTG